MKSTEDEANSYLHSIPRGAWVLIPRVCSFSSNHNLGLAYPEMKPACQQSISEREGFDFFSYVFKFTHSSDCIETLDRVCLIINSYFGLGLSTSACMELLKTAICQLELFGYCQQMSTELSPRYREHLTRTLAFFGKENTVFLNSKQFGVTLALLTLFCSVRANLQLQVIRDGGLRRVSIFEFDHEHVGEFYLKRVLNNWVYLHQDLPDEKQRIIDAVMTHVQQLRRMQKTEKICAASCPF